MRGKIIATVVAAALLISVAVVYAVTRRSAEVAVDPTISLRPPGLLVRDTETGHLALLRADGTRVQSQAQCARAYAAGDAAVRVQHHRPPPSRARRAAPSTS